MEKEITWKEAFFGKRGLKDIRTENKLNIPEYYIKSTRRLALAFGIICIVLGSLGGAFLFIILMVK